LLQVCTVKAVAAFYDRGWHTVKSIGKARWREALSRRHDSPARRVLKSTRRLPLRDRGNLKSDPPVYPNRRILVSLAVQ
jgi:hypothetical protein